MKNILLLILICCLSLSNRAQEQMNPSSRISGKAIKLPGFVTSPYFEEQVINFIHTPGIKVHINAPAETKFGKDKPTKLVLYHYRMATVQTGPSGKCRQKVMTGIIIYNT